MSEEYKEKAKLFLDRQLNEYKIKISKLKKKRKIIKVFFVSLIVVSITSSTVCVMLAGLSLPPLIIPILSGVAGLSTALLVKFNPEDKKDELNKTIDKLNKIKLKIDYVVSCNGNFTEVEYRQVIVEIC